MSRRCLYQHAGWMLVRAPLLPVERYLDLPSCEAPAASVPTDPLVRAALAVGSSNLLHQLDRGDARTRVDTRIAGKLLRYLIRMSARATPFGMFAGVGLARFGSRTDLRLTAAVPRTRMRPDMGWLLQFVAQLEARPEVRRELAVVTNQAAWLHGGRAVLGERLSVDGADGDRPVDIRATGVVRRALELARSPIGWRDLRDSLLQGASGATEEKVEGLLTQLWQESFLMTELRPPLTHPAPARYVEERLARVGGPARPEHALLSGLLDAMAAWDQSDLSDRPRVIQELKGQAEAAVPKPSGSPFQVDAALPLDGDRVAAPVAEEAARAAELLVRLHPPTADGRLEAYRQAFASQYGVDREVGLLELLDPERGLGPPWSAPPVLTAAEAAALRGREATLRAIALQALRDRRRTVVLDDRTLSELAPPHVDPETAPVSVDLAIFVLATSASDIDAGKFRVMVGPNLGAQSAGRNLGRFADLLGEPALEALRSVAGAELEHGSRELHAELVYLPKHGRVANVSIRPSVHPYEVPVMTMPGVEPGRAIPLSELVVGVRDGRFYVRWREAAGDLHVHAGHMLTARAAPIACRFLEDVARGARQPLSWFPWGPLEALPFLPRIEVGRIVLSPAQWRIDASQRGTSVPPDDDFAAGLRRWRSEWMVPRRVYLTAGDNRLLLDLDAHPQAELLREELRRIEHDGVILLQEALPGPEHAWLPGPGGHHLPELVVPLVQPTRSEVKLAPARTPSVVASASRAHRLRPPGSDWLYVKLYGSRNAQDELLSGPVRALGHFATASGLADRWFFVRYADPKPHLRVRFGGQPDLLLSRLLPHVCSWAQDLLDDGSCTELSFATYEREVERYGGVSGMALVEEIFTVDSGSVLELLIMLRDGRLSVDRTTLAVLSTSALLRGLGLTSDEQIALCRDSGPARQEVGQEYRIRKAELRRLLGRSNGDLDGLGEPALAPVLTARHRSLVPLAAKLRALSRSGELARPYDRICQSLVHMHCNRLLNGDPPTEQHVFGLLSRTLEGLARAPLGR